MRKKTMRELQALALRNQSRQELPPDPRAVLQQRDPNLLQPDVRGIVIGEIGQRSPGPAYGAEQQQPSMTACSPCTCGPPPSAAAAIL